MTTIEYTIPYQVLADTRLEAITEAVTRLRTGVRAVELVSAEPAGYGFFWDVTLRVEEDLGAGEPVEPVWDLDAPDPIDAYQGLDRSREGVRTMTAGLVYDHDALPEVCRREGHVPGCSGMAGGDHEYVVGLSMLRCSECGDLLDDGICENHGRLDDGREGQPEFNGAFDRW